MTLHKKVIMPGGRAGGKNIWRCNQFFITNTNGMLTIETAKISFTPKDGGEKRELNLEEKTKFLKENIKCARIQEAFLIGMDIGTDEGKYKLENSEVAKK